LIGRKPVNLIVGWCGQFLFFVVLRPFFQVVGEWRENQILIPDWTYFYCPGTTLDMHTPPHAFLDPRKNPAAYEEPTPPATRTLAGAIQVHHLTIPSARATWKIGRHNNNNSSNQKAPRNQRKVRDRQHQVSPEHRPPGRLSPLLHLHRWGEAGRSPLPITIWRKSAGR